MRLFRRNPSGRAFAGPPACLDSLIWNNQTALAQAKQQPPAKAPLRPCKVIQRFPRLNLAAAEHFGRTKAQLESTGLRVADADLLIAAVTMAHGGTLVTGNLRHYDRITGLPLDDWIRG